MKADVTIVPNKSSQAAEWKGWHEAMKSRFGKSTANQLFLQAWKKRGGSGSEANTSDLRNYLEKQGIVLDKSLIASVTDSAEDVFDKIGDTFKLGKYAVMGVGLMLLIPVGMFLFNIARNPIGAANAAASLKKI